LLHSRGNCTGGAKLDPCGIVYGGTTGRVATSPQDHCPPIFPPSPLPLPPLAMPCYVDSEGVYYWPDCASQCNGSAHINPCLHCVGGITGLPDNFGEDCVGVCGGSAIIDTCGVCSAGSTGIQVSANHEKEIFLYLYQFNNNSTLLLNSRTPVSIA